MDRLRLAQQLKKARERAGYASATKFAKVLGLSKSFVARVEAGGVSENARDLSIVNLELWAKACGTSVDIVLREPGEAGDLVIVPPAVAQIVDVARELDVHDRVLVARLAGLLRRLDPSTPQGQTDRGTLTHLLGLMFREREDSAQAVEGQSQGQKA
jgi:transcriptional regulator with XRE-family HTH domain